MTAEMKTSILDIRKRPLRRWHPHARRLIYLKRRASNLRNGYTFRYLIVAPARRRALLEIYATGMLCPVHLGTSDSYQRRRMALRPFSQVTSASVPSRVSREVLFSISTLVP